ncbi:MAG: Phosphoribosylaminoimidazole (AIR) synthetase [Candidatus Daviesbacteria bacterium GW2011_GWA1_36_8]|uniref:Phosphoribosylformylglycinamidine cyclo-ligase n=1 Tax=Candidatus Daviesbacteria bacterium GW2011_GWA1_36_8 TaxID=1618417 RepID=A0A0G0FQS8_9BACT|nr:MAG: Phosphoribosylaminoimidazole (AIR) synthetase [Candidatus Daviesbacteria bacterium GW2011_GWA1_36_8]
MKKLHYEQSGDNYKLKDPYKLIALAATRKTRKNLKRFSKYGIEVLDQDNSRGESAYRIKFASKKPVDFEFAHVEESIGTKNMIADELQKIYRESFYFSIGIDNVATIVNDLSTCGAFPLSFMLHIGAFPNEWYLEQEKIKALMDGTAYACNLAGCAWGGGESGTDRDIIYPGRSLLSGSATGIIISSSKVLSEEKLKDGDRIIVFESSGVHTNGITLLRKELLKRLPKGYKTKLSDGTGYGEALLTPSIIYSKLVEDLIVNTEVHYAVHITGHGWRKLMRSKRNFSYIVDFVPKPQPVFEFIQRHTNSSDKDMYETYNMGAGFAVFVPPSQVQKVLQIFKKNEQVLSRFARNKIKAWDAGFIKKGERKVVINPLRLEFLGEELILR